MKALLGAASAAALLAASAAEAATAIKVGQQVSGNLTTIGASYVWTIKLEKGVDYAWEMIPSVDGASDWTVKDPVGKTLHSDTPTEAGEGTGFEFRSAVAGTYKIIGKAVTNPNGKNTFYSMGFTKDCAPFKITTCYLNIGATQTRSTDFSGDQDWVLLKGMTVGNRYTVTAMEVGGVEPLGQIDVVLSDGTVVSMPGSATEGTAVIFTKTSTAPLYVRNVVDNDIASGQYSLALKAAP